MSKLEDLVPPLDLCRQIPPEAFADSALAWFKDDRFWFLQVRRNAPLSALCPAPTLAEIMAQMPSVIWDDGDDYTLMLEDNGTYLLDDKFVSRKYEIGYCMLSNDSSSMLDFRHSSTNPATAALKLWLELNERKM